MAGEKKECRTAGLKHQRGGNDIDPYSPGENGMIFEKKWGML